MENQKYRAIVQFLSPGVVVIHDSYDETETAPIFITLFYGKNKEIAAVVPTASINVYRGMSKEELYSYLSDVLKIEKITYFSEFEPVKTLAEQPKTL